MYTLNYVCIKELEERKEEGEQRGGEEVGRRTRSRGAAAVEGKERNEAEATFEEIMSHSFQN